MRMWSLRWSAVFLSCCLSSCLAAAGSCTLEKVIGDVARSVVKETAPLLLQNSVKWATDSSTDDSARTTETEPETNSCLPKDCAELAKSGHTKSGVFRVWPEGWSSCGMDVYCDFDKDGGGWTVIQRRGNFGSPNDYFYRRWRDYKFGFGNLTRDFWLGNDKIHHLTNQDNYVLRVNLGSKEGESRYAQYDEFFIENESNKYKLEMHGFTGDAGDSLSPQNGMFFTTQDRDNDNFERNCAVEFKGAWWHNKCHESNLNGLYLDGQHESFANGANWKGWKGYNYSYRDVEMKIRPKFFRKTEKMERQAEPVSVL